MRSENGGDPTHVCPNGHAMRVFERFRLEAEDDDPAGAELMQRLAATGVRLGADVTVWYCDLCGFSRADFDHGEGAP